MAKRKSKNSEPVASVGTPAKTLSEYGFGKASQDLVRLQDIVRYLNGEEVTTPEHKKIESQVVNFRTNLNGFMVMVVYKQMQRLARLLDAADDMERRLYAKHEIDTMDMEQLNKLCYTIQNSMNKTLEFLMGVTTDMNVRNMLNKPESFLTLPTQIDTDSRIKVDVNSYSKDGRDRIRTTAEWLIAKLEQQAQTPTQQDV